jgi:hypothetical protein
MQILAFLLSSLSSLFSLAATPLAPHASSIQSSLTHDAVFSLPDSPLAAVPLTCRNGVQKAARKRTLFINGMAGRGDESWVGLMLPAFHTQGCVANSFRRDQLLMVTGRYRG